VSDRTYELVEELQRLRPGSPILHHFRDVVDGIEWWNSLSQTERAYWLKRATSPTAADAWIAYKIARAGDAIVAKYAREFGRALFVVKS
jgi:hypothetical protein